MLTNSLYLIRSKVSAASDDKLRRQLDTADREIAAATLIVSDLLEFSHPRTANPTSVDVAELLTEAATVAPPPTGIVIEQADDLVPPGMADRDQIRQVIPGGGMDEQTREQVFEPFFSLKIKGTGLGLAVSKRIVETHSGTLRIASQPGQGTTALMRLPLSPAAVGASR